MKKKRFLIPIFVLFFAIATPITANAAGWTYTGETIAYVGGEVCEKYEYRLLGITWSTEWRCFNIADI